MTHKKVHNINKLKSVAQNMGSLLNDVVFLGGSVVELLITDKGAPPPRETMDVDVIVGVKSLVRYNQLEEKLRKQGFTQNPEIICRWIINNIIVDVMPTNEEILGFSNKWYPAAFKSATNHSLSPDTTIRLITAPCFIATKIQAFHDRGRSDFVYSHDMEDILNIIDGRPEIVDEVEKAPQSIKTFLSREFRSYLKKDVFHDSIISGLPTDPISQKRYYIIKERLETLSQIA